VTDLELLRIAVDAANAAGVSVRFGGGATKYYREWSSQRPLVINVERTRSVAVWAEVLPDGTTRLDEDLFARGDALTEAVLLAHELGHHRIAEHVGDARNAELVAAQGRAEAGEPISLAEAEAIYADELEAWDLGAELLRGAGLTPEQAAAFDRERSKRLATYGGLREACPAWSPTAAGRG